MKLLFPDARDRPSFEELEERRAQQKREKLRREALIGEPITTEDTSPWYLVRPEPK